MQNNSRPDKTNYKRNKGFVKLAGWADARESTERVWEMFKAVLPLGYDPDYRAISTGRSICSTI
jgi:hypothetical protein